MKEGFYKMEKGKYGIRLAFYGVVAFILAIFGWTTALILLTGVVIIGEKNEWASRQAIQAIFLAMISGIVSSFFGIFSFFYSIPFFGSVWGTIVSIIESIIDIAILVFAIIAIVRNAKGQEANVPLASKFAHWAYGNVIAKPVYQQPVYQQPAQPAAPVQPAAPAQPEASAQPVAPAADACSNCGAPLNGAAFCTKCGTPAAK